MQTDIFSFQPINMNGPGINSSDFKPNINIEIKTDDLDTPQFFSANSSGRLTKSKRFYSNLFNVCRTKTRTGYKWEQSQETKKLMFSDKIKSLELMSIESIKEQGVKSAKSLPFLQLRAVES